MSYEVISPDGIPIEPEPFETKAEARRALEAWVRRFERQGHYTTAEHERIPLGELASHCEIVDCDDCVDDDERSNGPRYLHEEIEDAEELGISDDNWANGTLDPET